MKKSFLLSVFVVAALSLSAQQIYPTLSEVVGNTGAQGNRGTMTITCPENSLYSHNVNYLSGFTSWSVYTVVDQIESDPGSAVNQITFYGLFYGSVPDRNFEIKFYYDNAGLPGTEFDSYSSFISGLNTGELVQGLPLYSYTYTFPASRSLDAGDWVSVKADGSDYWFWATASGGDGCVQQDGYTYRCDYGDVAFCLSGGAATPVSPWAIALGIALIATAAILRVRRSI
jgi:hypothetical protein